MTKIKWWLLVVALICTYLTYLLAISYSKTLLVLVDSLVGLMVIGLRENSLNRFMVMLSWAEYWINPILIVLPLIYLILKKQWKTSIIYTLITGGSYGLSFLIKDIVGRSRPELTALITETSNSFPSQHTLLMASWGMAMCFVVFRITKSLKLTVLTELIFILLTVLVGFSRIYLGVHYFSDVVAAVLISIAGTAFIMSFKNLLK